MCIRDRAGHEDKMVYTDPAEAASFLESTGADFLAVSIGTVHGVYKACLLYTSLFTDAAA